MTILLLDDERSFTDNREALVARSTDEAIALTDGLTELDELWLDFVLAGSDSTDYFLMHLVKRMKAQNPLTIHKVYFHTSSYSAIGLLRAYLDQLGIQEDQTELVEWKTQLVNEIR